jgi:hypothetical protein
VATVDDDRPEPDSVALPLDVPTPAHLEASVFDTDRELVV